MLSAPDRDGQGPRRDLGPIRWDVVVLWDQPLDQPQTVDLDPRIEECTPDLGEGTASERSQQPEANNVESGRAGCDNSSRLLVAHGRVNGQLAVILIDGGATMDLISSHMVREHGIPTELGPKQDIGMAGGQRQDVSAKAAVRVRMDKWTEQVEAHVTDLEYFDMILGKPWLTRHNPQINWRANVLQLWRDGKAVRIQATTAAKEKRSRAASAKAVPKVSKCTLREMRRLVKKGGQAFIATVSRAVDGKSTAHITELRDPATVKDDGAGSSSAGSRGEEPTRVCSSVDTQATAEEPSVTAAAAAESTATTHGEQHS